VDPGRLATYFGLPFLRPFTLRYISHELIADVVTGVAIFLVVLVIASVISHVITRSVRESSLGPLDRSLAFSSASSAAPPSCPSPS